MVAVVTGASKGIGRERALALASAGAGLRLIDTADLDEAGQISGAITNVVHVAEFLPAVVAEAIEAKVSASV